MDNNALLAFLITFIILDALIFGFWIYTAYCYHRDCYDRNKIDLSDYHVSTITKATPLVKNTIDKEQLINAPLHVYPPLPLPPNYTKREWEILTWVLRNQTAYRSVQDYQSHKKIILDKTLCEICSNTQATKKDIDYLVEIGRGITTGKYRNPYNIPILIQTSNYRFHVEETD